MIHFANNIFTLRFATALCPLTILLASGLFSCKQRPKEEPAKALGPFSKVSTNGGVQLTLIQGAENAVVSTSLNPIAYSVNNGVLSVNASYGSMTIAVKDLQTLSMNSGSVTSSGPLAVENLGLDIHAGSASFADLHVLKKLSVKVVNTGAYTFAGSATFLDLSIGNNTFFKGYNLTTDSSHVFSQAAVVSEVFVTKLLRVTIMGSADLHYKGNPAVVDSAYFGLGRAIPK